MKKLVLLLAVMGVVLGAGNVMARSLSEIQADLDKVTGNMSAYEKQIADLRAQGDSLKNAIAILQVEQQQLQALIDESQLRHDKLVEEIKATEKRIADNNEMLGYIIAEHYYNERISTVERLASSKNLSEFIDEEARLSNLSENIVGIVQENKKLKAELEVKREEVAIILEQQKAQKVELDAKKAEQQRILNYTQGQESKYTQMRNEADKERLKLMDEYYRKLQEIDAGGGGNINGYVLDKSYISKPGNCNSNMYPWDNSLSVLSVGGGWRTSSYGCRYGLDATLDPWQLYNRECVSYAAHRIYYGYNRNVKGFNGGGNAAKWPTTATAYMGAYRVWSDPQPGDVAVAIGGLEPYGHVMVVEQNYGDGYIRVSEMNWNRANYSEARVRINSVDGGFLRFPSR